MLLGGCQGDQGEDASEAQPARSRRRLRAFMGATSTSGYWRVPEHVSAKAFWGHVHVDLREAVIDVPVVDIRAKAVMGGITVTVPEGVLVEMRGGVLMGGTLNQVRVQDPKPDAPIVRVRARGLWGGVHARQARPRDDSELADPIERARQAAAQAMDAARTVIHSPWPGPQPPGPPQPPGSPQPPRSPRRRRNATSANGQHADTAGSESKIPSGTLTMLVSDIVGSTRLAEQLGDQRWHQVLETHNTILRGRVAERGGTEVKAQGDGFLFVFPSARAAVLAAIDIQRALAGHRAESPATAVDVRIGLHTGEVVAADDDVFGQNVVVASRIADLAGPGDIVVSGVTRDLTASASDLGFDQGTEVELKGMSNHWRIHHVCWTPNGAATPTTN